MKFQLGEFVRFVDENREGFITKIFNDEMVGVTGEDDFEIPVMINNLTRVHGHHSNTLKENGQNKPIKNENFIEKGVFLAALSDTNKASIIHFHIINRTSYQLLLSLKTQLKDLIKGEFSGSVSPESTFQIYSAALPELDLWPTFHLQCLFYTSVNKPLIDPLVFTIKFRAKDFSGSKQTIPSLNQQGWLFRIDEPDLVIDAEKIKESFFKSSEDTSA